VVEVALHDEDEEITVTVEDRTYYRGDDRGVAAANLVVAVNHEAVRASDHLLLIHAGGVERNGQAIVFPAAPAAGKSTLVAGLVERGFRALTDEVVAIEPATGDLLPYLRPIALKRGSWEVLPELRPRVPVEVEPYLTEQWFVPPSRIRADAGGRRSRLTVVVLPRYAPGEPTALTPLSRASALEALAGSSHNLGHWGQEGFRVLGGLVADARCHRLVSGSLDGACDAIGDL
jgi:hypothetical protein